LEAANASWRESPALSPTGTQRVHPPNPQRQLAELFRPAPS
jgi:hypothetical protein